MATARDIMTGDATCASVNDTLVDAARKMKELDVGALPICGDDNRLAGMVTDRDIVVKCLAEGGDPSSTKVSDLAEGKPVTIGADDPVPEILRTMTQYGVRRLPVIDGHELIGMVSQADVAKNLPDENVADLVQAISEAPANNRPSPPWSRHHCGVPVTCDRDPAGTGSAVARSRGVSHIVTSSDTAAIVAIAPPAGSSSATAPAIVAPTACIAIIPEPCSPSACPRMLSGVAATSRSCRRIPAPNPAEAMATTTAASGSGTVTARRRYGAASSSRNGVTNRVRVAGGRTRPASTSPASIPSAPAMKSTPAASPA
jgi:CBS domain-containing protein